MSNLVGISLESHNKEFLCWFQGEVSVEGLLGITVDNQDVLLIHLDDIIRKDKSCVTRKRRNRDAVAEALDRVAAGANIDRVTKQIDKVAETLDRVDEPIDSVAADLSSDSEDNSTHQCKIKCKKRRNVETMVEMIDRVAAGTLPNDSEDNNTHQWKNKCKKRRNVDSLAEIIDRVAAGTLPSDLEDNTAHQWNNKHEKRGKPSEPDVVICCNDEDAQEEVIKTETLWPCDGGEHGGDRDNILQVRGGQW